jgi:hypothetical protein
MAMNEHTDYIENTHGFDSSLLTPEDVEVLGQQLNDDQTGIKVKKIALGKLVHRGDLQAYNILKAYAEHPDKGLEEWSMLAFGECGLFLHGDICGDDDADYVFTGVGKNNNMLRIYLLVLPLEGKFFELWQHDIIEKEMTYVARDLQCDAVEWFDCKPHYVGFSVLIPETISIAQFIEKGIAACNEFGGFMMEEYYCGSRIPDAKEIEEIIQIVLYGENETFVGSNEHSF